MLPYSLEVLFSAFGRHNEALWPLALVFYGLAPLLLAWVFSGHKPLLASVVLGAYLALAWLSVGVGFFWLRFAPFDSVAPYEAALFLVQAGLFGWAGFRGRLRLASSECRWVGLLLVLMAMLLGPMVDAQGGHSPRWFALAPGATVLASLGILLMVRAPWYLWPIPLAWTAKAGLVAWWLGLDQDLLLPVLGLAALAFALWSRFRHR